MKSPQGQSGEPRRVEEPRRPVQQETADAPRKPQAQPSFVDPYDMRTEAQPEEPGYGHGV
jgi:hypothetical protein